MPDEIVGVKLQVEKGNTEEATKSFRAQLREATAELIKIQEKFGDISPEAQKAAKGVAELRDKIKDAAEVSELFDPEKKFQAIVGAAQGLASGFAAVQGAMALVGGESEVVEQALLKVQAAMALAQGLSGVKAGIEDFKRLGALIQSTTLFQKANAAATAIAAGAMRLFGGATVQTGTAFTVLKGAIVASGIGLFVVLIGTLVSKMKEWTASTSEATEAQRKLNQEMAERANQFTDEIVDIYEKDKQLQIARAKAAGKTEQEIVEITRKANETIIAERRKTYQEQLVQGHDATDANKLLHKAETDSELFELGLREKARTEAEKKADDARNKSKAERDKEAQARRQIAKEAAEIAKQTADELFAIQNSAEATELRALAEKFRERMELYRKDGRDTSDLLVAWVIERGAIEKKYLDERAAAERADADRRRTEAAAQTDAILQEQDRQTAREEEYSRARKQLAREEQDVKIRSVQAVAGALDGFAALAGEQTAAGKAFAVTSATIQAILGAQQAFTALSGIPIVGPALGAVAAAGAIAAGIANVRKILAVQVPGQGGGGGGSAPSLGGGPPLSPQAPATQNVQLDRQSINQMGNATIKTYVLESDVTGSQNRINRIQSAASFK